MQRKKKIAILNFPIDSDFGGYLQRRALMEALRADRGTDYLLGLRSVDSI